MRTLVTRFIGLMILAVVASCDKESNPSASFDRGPLLENLGENIIVPAYDTLARRTDRLLHVIEDFNESPDMEGLNKVREQWIASYIAFQHCGFYNFGPADEFLFNTSVNSFPTSKTKVNNNISSGTYDLSIVSNNDAKGFSAMDYLLYGLGPDDDSYLLFYTTEEDATNRKQYLLDVAEDIQLRSKQVFEEWSAAGENYIGTFVSRTGTDVGSSTGMLLNAAIQYLERDLRDNKIGIPLGIRSLNVPIPNNCEALNAQESILLATESTRALQNLYLGKAQTDGVGFDDYLKAINARYNGGLLDDAIQPQLQLTLTKVEAIPEPYSETVVSNPTPAMAAYQELQKLVILFKTDMTSSLGILITYQDNDGD
jgi:predicted lipoprotein